MSVRPAPQWNIPSLIGIGVTAGFLFSFTFFMMFVPSVTDGNIHTWSTQWVPFLDIYFSLRVDGLSLLFALLITGIGFVVSVYSLVYMQGHDETRRYWLHLLLFTISMLGTVLAGDMITLYVFWELTAITSFLLIGFDRKRAEARFAAWQALLITVTGGFTMLAGITLLPAVTGTYDLNTILTMGDTIRADALYPVILTLILVGAFTKSCQVPVHFWLPGAMVAPTPVSAFLHSATMVKAGIYLLARLHPVLSGTDGWIISLSVAGGVTALIGAVLALKQTDIKLLLAYSTLSALGIMVLLLSGSGETAVMAALTFLIAHALYKSTLFLVGGIVDKQTGTRDLNKLGRLRLTMPITAIAATLAGLSMIGIPPFAGCLCKQGVFDALSSMPWPTAVTATIIVTISLMVVIVARVVYGAFFASRQDQVDNASDGHPAMWLGPLLLAGLGLVFGLMPDVLEPLVSHATSAALGKNVEAHLAVWHGFNAPFMSSLLALGLGVSIYILHPKFRGVLERAGTVLPLNGTRMFHALVNSLIHFATWVGRRVQTGILRDYFAIVFSTMVVMITVTMIRFDVWPSLPSWPELYFYEWAVVILTAAAAITVSATHKRLLAICALGVVGANLALLFVMYGAPDVAMTQLMVEILIVVILTLVIVRLPRFNETAALVRRQKVMHIAISVLVGSMTTALLLLALSGPFDPHLSEFFISNAADAARGRNIVNVILVDFRGLDTLGEITVLGISGVAAYALIKVRLNKGGRNEKS